MPLNSLRGPLNHACYAIIKFLISFLFSRESFKNFKRFVNRSKPSLSPSFDFSKSIFIKINFIGPPLFVASHSSSDYLYAHY